MAIPAFLKTVARINFPEKNAEYIASAVFRKLKNTTMKETTEINVNEEPQMLDFQLLLEGMYGTVNKNHTNEYIYSYLSRTTGYLCKKMATKDTEEIDFIRPISWLFALASRCGIRIQDAFVARFPDCCPYCLEAKCICIRTGKKPKNYMPAHEVSERLKRDADVVRNSHKLIGFDEAKKTISSIYAGNEIVWHFAGPWFHISKLFEEISEVHEAMSKFFKGERTLEAISDEIAEVLAWIVSAWDIVKPNKSLDKELISYYFKGCPVCHNKACNCPPDSNRPGGLINPKDLIKIKEFLKNLRDSMPQYETDIDELIRSIATSTEAHSESIMRLTLVQINHKLRFIKDAIPPSDNLNRGLINTIIGYVKKSFSGLFET